MKPSHYWSALCLSAALLAGCQSAKAPDTQQSAAQIQPVQIPQYSAQSFYDTVTLYGSSINHNSSQVLVSSDASGVFNAYSYPLDGSTPTQLTHSTTNAISGVSWFPADNRVLYTSDEGGNELHHLYVLEEDGSSRDITPGEKLKAQFMGWHQDDIHFYVATNERDAKAFDLYRYDSEDYSRTLVFENTQDWELGDVSKNGNWLALMKVHSNADDDIYVANLHQPAAPAMHITPHEGKVAHNVFSFTPDSDELIYGSNAQGEFTQAWSYDMLSGQRQLHYADNWDVSFVYYSDNGRYQVIGVNADAQTRLTILDTYSGKELQLPTLPAGDLRGVNFSRDEQRMVFYINSDTSPSNLFSWQVGSSAAKQLSQSLNPQIDAQYLVSSEVVRFPSFDDVTIPAIQYQPKQASASHKVPAIIFIHGGPGGQTRKGYSAIIQHLVNHGYAVLGVNNRGSSGYGKTFFHLDDKRHGEDDLQDIVYGKKYLQSLDWVDGERIAVMGGSYGGYLTMAAMAFTDEFKLGINIFGVTNWVRTLESIPPWWESFRQSLYDELGDPATDKARLTRISPLFHADKIKKPVLVVQGANDPRVLQVESDEMVEAIRANNVPVDYVLFADEGHGFRSKANRITAQEAYLRFLQTYL